MVKSILKLIRNFLLKAIRRLRRLAPVFDDLVFAWIGARKLRALFQNKTVAIVGNGPDLIGRELGGAIDDHDVVVRINLVRPTGRESDIGSRTDVRLIGATMLERHVPHVMSLSGNEVVLTTGKNRGFMKRLGLSCRFYPPLTPMHAFSLFKAKYGAQINIAPTDRPPRTGIVLLSLLIRYGNAKKISLYGFSLEEAEFTKAVDFASVRIRTYEGTNFELNHCDPKIEVDLLRQLERLGAVSMGQ